MVSISLHNRIARFKSGVMYGLCIAFTAAILALLLLVTGYLIVIGFKSINLAFFTQVTTEDFRNPGGMKNSIIGTGILVALASMIGIPIGMLAGVYLAEYEAGSWLASPVRFLADVLAGVPSIVVGILGYELFVYPIGHYSGWAGAGALAFIMIPLVARTSEEMLRLVPNSYREASVALGASKWRTIMQVIIPSATGSIVTGIMLAVARIAGETAPLLFTALGSRYLTLNPSEQFPSMTQQIYDDGTSAYPALRQQAWAGILVLITLIFIVNLSIRYATRQRRPSF